MYRRRVKAHTAAVWGTTAVICNQLGDGSLKKCSLCIKTRWSAHRCRLHSELLLVSPGLSINTFKRSVNCTAHRISQHLTLIFPQLLMQLNPPVCTSTSTSSAPEPRPQPNNGTELLVTRTTRQEKRLCLQTNWAPKRPQLQKHIEVQCADIPSPSCYDSSSERVCSADCEGFC